MTYGSIWDQTVLLGYGEGESDLSSPEHGLGAGYGDGDGLADLEFGTLGDGFGEGCHHGRGFDNMHEQREDKEIKLHYAST